MFAIFIWESFCYRLPPKTLKPEDFNQNNPNQRYRPQLGFTPGSGYRHDKDVTAAVRMIR